VTAKLATLAVIALAIGTTGANAHSAKTYDPDARQAYEQQRYEAARRNGSITYLEGLAIRAEAQSIDARKSELEADGRLSKHDLKELKARHDQLDRNISAAETNGRIRPWPLFRVGR
jgi:hypothetical protein